MQSTFYQVQRVARDSHPRESAGQKTRFSGKRGSTKMTILILQMCETSITTAAATVVVAAVAVAEDCVARADFVSRSILSKSTRRLDTNPSFPRACTRSRR